MGIGVVKCVLLIVVAYLALVGLAQLGVSFGRWLTTGGTLRDCWLVVAAAPGEEGLEMRLRQAHSQLLTTPALQGARLVVADCGLTGEARELCRCFCQETGTPLLLREELPRFLTTRGERGQGSAGAEREWAKGGDDSAYTAGGWS